MEKQETKTASPYELDGCPPLKVAIPLGLQHVLAMFVGNLTHASDYYISLRNRIRRRPSGGIASECHAHSRNHYTFTGLYHWTRGSETPNCYGNKFWFIGVCQSVAGVMGNGVVAYGAIMAACFIVAFLRQFSEAF